MADATKLSVRVIDALEGGRLSALPSGIYRRSIVRAVAAEVGLDPEQLLREFSGAHPEALPALVEPAQVTDSAPAPRVFQGALAFVGGVLPMVAGIAYFVWPSADASEATPAAVMLPSRPADAWRPEIVPAGGFAEPPPAILRPVVVTLTISSKCQLRVVADGREVLSRAMEQGETMPIDLGGELLLIGDNAGAVQFSINGQVGRMLGEAGGVLSVRIGRDDYEDFLVRY